MEKLIKGMTTLEYQRQWRKNNYDKTKKYQLTDRWKNKEKIQKKAKIHYQKKKYELKEKRDKLRLDVLEYYSNGLLECNLCGCDIFDVLDVDHIDGGGNIHRKKIFNGHVVAGGNFYRWLKKNGYPSGFRILCKNCNYLEYLKTIEIAENLNSGKE